MARPDLLNPSSSPADPTLPARLRRRLTAGSLAQLLPHAADRAAVASMIEPRQTDRAIDPPATLRDALVLVDPDPQTTPTAVFDRLRWGGVVLFASPSPRRLDALRSAFVQTPGYQLDGDPIALPHPHPVLRRLTRPVRFSVARKVLLDPPDTLTSRYSYHLALEPNPDETHGYAVVKRVPTLEQAVSRLRALHPEADEGFLERTAVGLVRKAFPVFLTREAAFLKILRKHLPEPMRPRVPEALGLDTDDQGHVRALTMTWLRQGPPEDGPLSLRDFARQAAELLNALHTHVGVMHLDLRLDNLLVTPHGVSIIDFGSAIRFGEDITQSRVLAKVFTQMLDASQIAEDLRRLRFRKRVTSSVFRHCFDTHHPGAICPAIDLFALVHQMTRPHDNPDLVGLVNADPNQAGYESLARVRRAILNPEDPEQPATRTVRDLADALRVM